MINIRPVEQDDKWTVQALLGQLGYVVAIQEVSARLDGLLAGQDDPILIAMEGDAPLGLIAMHWAPMLHHSKPLARITALVVSSDARGRGVGRALVEAAADLARKAGCGVLELTTSTHRVEAHAFYKAIGFTSSSLRLHRTL